MKPHLLLTAVVFVVMIVSGAVGAELALDDPIAADAVEPIVKVVYTGSTAISTSLASKATTSEKATVLQTATVAAFSAEKYPLQVSTEVRIDGIRCSKEKCGYWITATRGGREVATNSPIWLVNGNAPYHTVVSDVYDKETNTETITVQENVKGAVIGILTAYASRQPIGIPTTGTKL